MASPSTTPLAGSFAGRFALTVARRSAVATRRTVVTVPKVGTQEAMEAEAISQIRARLAYQKEILAKNPHKSHEEEWAELWNWIKISIFVCAPIVTFAVTKDLLFEEHHHRHEGTLPEYMGIRSKDFPWECGQCDLFDLACWKKCRAEK
eukprot:Nitzschia sp. Nitz4//scaffold44_size153857//107386//107979//NITZ4_002735-RA/size153857-processed-gene-0.108-mRNA-1//-1//CDS//3329552199//3444//frame0